MKKQGYKIFFLAITLFFFFTAGLHAQVDSAKAAKLQARLADTVCQCISQTDTSTLKSVDDVQGLMMKCFMGNGMGLFMEYTQASGVEMSDIQGMQGLVIKIGAQLYANCPGMLKVMSKVANDTQGYEKLMQQYKDATQGSGNKTNSL